MKEVMKLALAALETCHIYADAWTGPVQNFDVNKVSEAVRALRQAIEQAERFDKQPTKILSTEEVLNSAGFYKAEKREWVGLTLEEKKEYLAQDFGGSRSDAMDWADKRLKEKNCG